MLQTKFMIKKLRIKQLILSFIIIFALKTILNHKAARSETLKFSLNNLPFKTESIKRIQKGEVVSSANVTEFFDLKVNLKNSDFDETQKLDIEANKLFSQKKLTPIQARSATVLSQKSQKVEFQVAGIKKASCFHFLYKLSQYEKYKDHMSSISDSKYEEKEQRLTLQIASRFLPIKIYMSFVFPRIKEPGSYPFLLPEGLFPGLKGTVHAIAENSSCLIFLEGNYEGEHSGVNSTLLSIAIETLLKFGLEKLLLL